VPNIIRSYKTLRRTVTDIHDSSRMSYNYHFAHEAATKHSSCLQDNSFLFLEIQIIINISVDMNQSSKVIAHITKLRCNIHWILCSTVTITHNSKLSMFHNQPVRRPNINLFQDLAHSWHELLWSPRGNTCL